MPNPTTDIRPESSAAARIFRVGQLAKETGKTVRAIRFYEELGLLVPIHRTPGGFRQYDESALLRIHWIDRLQELGFSLSDIRDFLSTLEASETGPEAMEKLHTFYARKLIETRQAIARMQSLQSELEESLQYLITCQTCAPKTEKSHCSYCGTGEHEGVDAPALVAAIHTNG